MNQELLKLLEGSGLFNRLNSGNSRAPKTQGDFSFLNRPAPAATGVDPNLGMILGSRNVRRNRRDTAGNDIAPGSQNYWSGPSGLDAYKSMQQNNTGSSLPGFGGSSTAHSIGSIINKVEKAKARNPNEVQTAASLRRVLNSR